VALGVSRAGEELSGILNEIQDNNPQLLRVRAGTPIGILFVDSVTDGVGADNSLEQLQSFQQGRDDTTNSREN